MPCDAAAAARVLKAKQMVTGAEVEEHAPALAATLRDTCKPGSVVLVAAAGALPLHVIALYAPSGALCPMVKGLEKQGLLFRLEAGGSSDEGASGSHGAPMDIGE